MRNGEPEIDDLEASLEELGDVGGGEATVHASDGRVESLVDVHSGDGLAGLWGVREVWATTADG